MSIPTKIIWVASIALTAAAWWYGHLSFWIWCLIMLCTVILIAVFKPADEFDKVMSDLGRAAAKAPPTEPQIRLSVPVATIMRNCLMQHQEMRRTDPSYQNSPASKIATSSIQALNEALDRAKPPRTLHD